MIKIKAFSEKNTEELIEMMRDFNKLDNYPFNKKITTKNLKFFLKNSHLGNIWVVEINKKLIGYIILTFCFSFEHKGQCAYIDEVYINAKYRNQGIGTETLKYIIRKSKKLKIKMLYLEVEKHNTRAASIYEKLGFKNNDRQFMTMKT